MHKIITLTSPNFNKLVYYSEDTLLFSDLSGDVLIHYIPGKKYTIRSVTPKEFNDFTYSIFPCLAK